MPTNFRECRDDEFMLLPVDMRDWLPEGHLAYLIRDMVREMDLSPFYLPYEGDGRRNRPYEPRMMVTVLIYAYATGVFSSRRIARKLHEDVAFRMLCGGSFPRHRTICEFRRRHLGDFRHLFLEVVRLAREAGIVKLGTVTVDGTKVRANASRRKATGHGRMLKEEKRLEAEIAALLDRAGEVDAEEDAVHGADSGDGGVPEEIARRESRLGTIRAAKERLEARQRAADDAKGRKPGQDRNPRGGKPYRRPYGEPEATAQGNFTDPESRIMKTGSEGFRQCFNAQVAVDGGGAARLDQAGDGVPPLRRPGLGEGEGRVGPGVPGVERKAHGDGPGGLKPAEVATFGPGMRPRGAKRGQTGAPNAENPTGVRGFRVVRRSAVTRPNSEMTCGAGS